MRPTDPNARLTNQNARRFVSAEIAPTAIAIWTKVTARAKTTSELTNAQAEQTRQFLVGFAQALVRAQASTGAGA